MENHPRNRRKLLPEIFPRGGKPFVPWNSVPAKMFALDRFEQGAVLPSGTTGASPREKESVMSLPVIGIELPEWDQALAGPYKRKAENGGRKAVLPQSRTGL